MALARPLPVVKSQHSGVTLSMRVGERRELSAAAPASPLLSAQPPLTRPANRSSTPPTLADRKRRYSRDIYWYTLQVWNDNRSEIE
jgi:hypothetical protein